MVLSRFLLFLHLFWFKKSLFHVKHALFFVFSFVLPHTISLPVCLLQDLLRLFFPLCFLFISIFLYAKQLLFNPNTMFHVKHLLFTQSKYHKKAQFFPKKAHQKHFFISCKHFYDVFSIERRVDVLRCFLIQNVTLMFCGVF